METNWYVITGAPSSGKTTLLGHLASLGYEIVPEAARAFIDEEMKSGKTLEEIRTDERVFQRNILCRVEEVENMLDPQQLHFFDRGIPDNIEV